MIARTCSRRLAATPRLLETPAAELRHGQAPGGEGARFGRGRRGEGSVRRGEAPGKIEKRMKLTRHLGSGPGRSGLLYRTGLVRSMGLAGPAAGLGLACASSGAVVDAEGENGRPPAAVASAPASRVPIPGEALVVLEEGAEPPARVGSSECEAVSWSGPRTVLLRCTPAPEDSEATGALVRSLVLQPGVRSASPNYVLKER